MGFLYDDLAPNIAIEIEEHRLADEVLEFVTDVSVELSFDRADMITLKISNPVKTRPGKTSFSSLLWTDHKAFAPGNQVSVWMGYGWSSFDRVSDGLIRKWMPHFPQTGMPFLQIKAMDASCLMMDGQDPIWAKSARQFETGTTLGQMALSVFADYGFDVTNVEEASTAPAVATIKKAGMSDYQFLKALANQLSYEFYIRFEDRYWRAYWRPQQIDTSYNSTFTWGPDYTLLQFEGEGVLLDFSPEFSIQSASTDVEVFYFDWGTSTWEQIVYPPSGPDKGKKAEFKWLGDETSIGPDLAGMGLTDAARGLRIKADGSAVEVIPNTLIRTAEEAIDFARSWWVARQNNLVTGKGRIIGDQKVKPGQVHRLDGLGEGLSGDWFFVEVMHRFSRGGTPPFVTEFMARRVLP